MGVPSRQRAIRRIAGNWSSAASWPATTLRRRSDLPSRRGSGRFGPVASDRPGRGYSRMRKRERMREHELTHLRAHRTSDGSLVVEFWANELPYQIRIRDKGVLQEIREALEHVEVAGGHPAGRIVVPECGDCSVPMRRANPLQLICPACLHQRSSPIPRVPISDEYRSALLALRVEHQGYTEVVALIDAFLRHGDPRVLEELLGIFSIDHQDVWPIEAHELLERIWAEKDLDEEL